MNRRNLSTSRYEAISLRNFSIVALLDEADELDQALGLFRARLGQGPIRAPVFRPVVAEEIEAAQSLRPQEQALVGVEAVLQERAVHGLDERIQAEISLLVPARDGERHFGHGGMRGRHTRLAKEGEGERLASLRGVERTALQAERMEPVEILVVGLLQIDQERTLQAPRRRHVGGVSRVAESDPLVSLSLREQGPTRPRELKPEEVPLARLRPRALRLREPAEDLPVRRPGARVAWPGILLPGSRCEVVRPWSDRRGSLRPPSAGCRHHPRSPVPARPVRRGRSRSTSAKSP